jgi:RHS repeat-associated protein
VEPTLDLACTADSHCLNAYDVQYWDGTSWNTVPNGSITGNDKVWRKITFPALTTGKIKIVVKQVQNVSWSRGSMIAEIEAYSTDATPVNVALAANGGTTFAYSRSNSQNLTSYLNDDNRKGEANKFWQDNSPNDYSNDWAQIEFSSEKSINEIHVFTSQNNWNAVEPNESMTTTDGIKDFDVQYWNNTQWVTVPGGSITGNNKVWRKITFPALTTGKIRVVVKATNSSSGGYSRIAEIAAYSTTSNNTQRFDAWGNRIATSGNQIPQYGYTGREADETGLIYYRARYYDPTIGRFTQRDPIGLQGGINPYAYVNGNPINWVDPLGLAVSLNLFPRNEDIYNRAEKMNPIPGVFTVGVHSNPVRWDRPNGRSDDASIAAGTLAQQIRDAGWKEGTPIMILGCYSGASPANGSNAAYAQKFADYQPLAQQVSNILQTPVAGATAYAWYQNDGSLPAVAPDKKGVDWSRYGDDPNYHIQPDYNKQEGYAWYAPNKSLPQSLQTTTGNWDPGAPYASGGQNAGSSLSRSK